MSLTPIAIAFGLVAAVFIAFAAASVRWESEAWGSSIGGKPAPPPPAGWTAAIRVVWLPAAVEALVVVLFAALWFGSLGSGGWVTLFLLVGALAGGADRWTRRRLLGTPARDDLRQFLASLLRYLVAGGVCAWCLT
ncbi:MAG TPA: hypothetical protein VEH83_06510 [Gemmatimonadales bacterium]|nr:hypothetical protein [Gemmatimonadales bacterium]